MGWYPGKLLEKLTGKRVYRGQYEEWIECEALSIAEDKVYIYYKFSPTGAYVPDVTLDYSPSAGCEITKNALNVASRGIVKFGELLLEAEAGNVFLVKKTDEGKVIIRGKKVW